jgi:ABC-type phosphate/phosphonate transport system substrate-binding protein
MCALAGSSCGCVDLTQPPVRVGVARYEIAPTLGLLPKWSLLNRYLQDELRRPVAFQLMTPHQIDVHLSGGRLDFAYLVPEDYGEIAGKPNHRILCVPIDRLGQTRHRGLIVVPAQSPAKALDELKGYRFHYLADQEALKEAALGALMESNVLEEDLSGLKLATGHLSSAEVVKSIVVESKAAGVISQAEYNKWPASGGFVLSPVPLPSRDMVRVLGETVVVPNAAFVASVHADPDLVERVRESLMEDKFRRNIALAPMGYVGFTRPLSESEYLPFIELYRKLRPIDLEEMDQSMTQPAESAPAGTRPEGEQP